MYIPTTSRPRDGTQYQLSGNNKTGRVLEKRRSWFRRRECLLLPTLTILAILGAWELYAQTVGVDPLFFSYPSEIWGGFLTLYRGPLMSDLAPSGHEFVVGLALGAIGIPAGLIVGSVRRSGLALAPISNGIYATPTPALTPLFVSWVGL